MLLRLEAVRVVEHLTVAVPQDVRRVPALHTEHARLEHRREDGLHQRLPGLEVLAADRDTVTARELAQRGCIDSEVGRSVRERHALQQRGVRVQHRRGDRRVVGIDGRIERLEVRVGRSEVDEDLGRAAPDHHEPVAAVLLTERTDVVTQRVEHRAPPDRPLRVGSLEPRHVRRVERRAHRPDRAQRFGDRLEVALYVKHAGVDRRDVRVVGVDVPGTEDDVVEVRERDEVLDERRAALVATPQPHRPELGEGPHRLGHPPADQLDAGDQRRRDCAQADAQDAEAPISRPNGRWRGERGRSRRHEVSGERVRQERRLSAV